MNAYFSDYIRGLQIANGFHVLRNSFLEVAFAIQMIRILSYDVNDALLIVLTRLSQTRNLI